MAEPILTFLFNYGSSDTPYVGTGGPDGDWKEIHITVSGSSPDKKVYTGGGINGSLSTPTAPYGSRDATIRPLVGILPVPQVYIESESENIMYHVPLASGNPNTNRYVFGIFIDGYIASDLFLEMWDDHTFSTTNLPTLSGTDTYPHSMFNAIRTTNGAPPASWTGSSTNAKYLAGYGNRLGLKNADSAQNEAVYFNLYVAIPYDAPLFNDQPVETFRYLYI